MISHLESNVFNHLRWLWFLYLSNNEISHIQNGNFSGLKEFRQIDLAHNKLKYLHGYKIITPQEIWVFDLSYNGIWGIPVEFFRYLPGLLRIYLAGNNITLYPNIFENLTKLLELDLRLNFISFISPGSFSYLISLDTLNLNNNELETLSAAMFEDKEKALEKMTKLFLSHNKISVIAPTTFSRLHSLQVVNLEGNCLTQLEAHMFRNLKSLVELNVNDNDIVNIDDETFKYSYKIDKISVKNHMLISLRWIFFLQPKTQILHFECEPLDILYCKATCRQKSKVPKIQTVLIKSRHKLCQYCDCQCKSLNCSQECGVDFYHIMTNEFGCGYCKCSCPLIDCDSPCGGTSLGVHGEKDNNGCITKCNGCKNKLGKLDDNL